MTASLSRIAQFICSQCGDSKLPLSLVLNTESIKLMPTPLKSKGFYEPSGREILVSVSISVILTVAVIAGCIALLVMGFWYLAWIPIPVGLLVGLLINVVFRGKDDVGV